MCDLYLEYDVYSKVKIVMTLKKPKTNKQYIEAEEIREKMHEYKEIAIACHF